MNRGTERVEVPTEDGRRCVIDFERQIPGAWTLHISDELLAQSPEGIHAALGQALLVLKDRGTVR